MYFLCFGELTTFPSAAEMRCRSVLPAESMGGVYCAWNMGLSESGIVCTGGFRRLFVMTVILIKKD